MHVNITPLRATIESTARCVYMITGQAELRMMKHKVKPAGMSPAEVGGEQSVSSPFENLISALNY